ncbi:MAG: hypothetical protein AMXMBFR53_13280 [Gemmatimonadota bacterium]
MRAWIAGVALVAAGAAPVLGQVAANPHGDLPADLDCSACHTAEGWKPLRSPLLFTHGARGGFLITGAHEQASCSACHTDLRFNGPDVAMSDCAGCHLDVHGGRQVQPCTACHVTTSFRDVDGEAIHARTAFPLTGAHRQVTCESCHRGDQGGAFTALPTDCASCHMAAYEGARVVDHVAAGYPTDCTACHSTLAWADTPSFDHAAVSGGFDLRGAHRDLRCASCHALPGMGLLFAATDADDCAGCHQDDFDRRHGGTGIPTTCAVCHTVDSWDVDDFDHGLTGFDLVGRHTSLSCSSCHVEGGPGLKYPVPARPDDCVACHQADYDDEHGGSGFPTTCLSCHNANDWDDASFDHTATAFPLVGAHQGAECSACHGPPAHLSAAFLGPEECLACHQRDYDEEHAGSGFPTTCLSCHNQARWEDATLDHVTLSGGYALEGPHAQVACDACHTLPDYGLKYRVPAAADECVACHQADYDAGHPGTAFPTTCLSCHASDRWEGATFDHAAQTGYALDGPHAQVACATCHTVPDYGLKGPRPATADDCVACHQADYDASHPGSAFPTTCLSCHARDRWEGATFDHGARTGYVLEGPHAPVACATCHTMPGYGLRFPTPTAADDCVACHQADYDANHAGSGFPATCLSCHARDRWEGANFDHVQATGFELVGPHAPLACTSCHGVPGYVLLFPPPATPDDCVACHQADYDREHAGSGFPTTCLSCHASDRWEGATFDHAAAASGFVLVGAHAVTPCASCHTIPGYGLVFPRPASADDCVACHQADYAPAHGAEGYPTTCASCHNATAWEPSTFDHDRQYFPIHSGAHREEWSRCADCHTNPADFGVFTCLTCHEHRQSAMDDKHKEVTGYAYTSAACLSCHPVGKAG